jgi:hypothetical protein
MLTILRTGQEMEEIWGEGSLKHLPQPWGGRVTKIFQEAEMFQLIYKSWFEEMG